jgi:hypothetical protein
VRVLLLLLRRAAQPVPQGRSRIGDLGGEPPDEGRIAKPFCLHAQAIKDQFGSSETAQIVKMARLTDAVRHH